MTDVPLKYQEAVNTYQVVDFEGFRLHPIKVRDYRAFSNARPAIDFLQQSLPVRWLSVPLLSAYYGMEYECYEKGEEPPGLFARALLFLALALDFMPELDEWERVRRLSEGILVDGNDHGKLVGVVIGTGEDQKTLTPVIFQRMRPVLAAQNGVRLESEDANPELVEADRDIAEQNSENMDFDVSHLVTGVCALTGKDETELMDWPILKLTRRSESIERILGYLVCSFGEMSGAKFKGGSPFPSPFYPKTTRGSRALIDMNTFTNGQQVSVSENAPSGLTPGTNPS